MKTDNIVSKIYCNINLLFIEQLYHICTRAICNKNRTRVILQSLLVWTISFDLNMRQKLHFALISWILGAVSLNSIGYIMQWDVALLHVVTNQLYEI